jgi:hypothetical protein
MEKLLIWFGVGPTESVGLSISSEQSLINWSTRRQPVIQQELVWPKASSVDYLADRLLASYFDAREHESYYNSLKHADTRRDFHETIIPVLIDFIGEALSNLQTSALDAVIEAAATARKVIRPTKDIVA